MNYIINNLQTKTLKKKMKTNLNEVSKEVYEANKLKGFDVKKENLGQTLCLIHSEISEALEAIRKNRYANLSYFEIDDKKFSDIVSFESNFKTHIKDTFEDEIADTFTRLMDLVGALDIDIDRHIELKRRYNSLREYKHGKEF